MNSSEDHIELFERYLSGELPQEESQAFDQKLQTDKTFKQQFEAYQLNLNLIRSFNIAEETAEVIKRKKNSRHYRRWGYSLSALAASLLIFFMLFPKRQNPANLFDAYFQPFPDAVSARSKVLAIDDAMRMYGEGDFIGAKRALGNIEAKSDTIYFYKSISELVLKQPQPALQGLYSVTEASAFYEASTWYRGMAHLLLEQLDSAEYYFDQIKASDPNKAKAESILEQIK